VILKNLLRRLQLLDTAGMVVTGLAVVLGGIGLTNTLLVSAFERTREIAGLRPVEALRYE
jgi:putative ABC transport system permease protein